jgi:hypothetical protein
MSLGLFLNNLSNKKERTMPANKPQPQQGGQKPNKEDEFNQGGQNRDQSGQQQGGQQKGRDTQDTPNNQRGQGGQGGQRGQGGGR